MNRVEGSSWNTWQDRLKDIITGAVDKVKEVSSKIFDMIDRASDTIVRFGHHTASELKDDFVASNGNLVTKTITVMAFFPFWVIGAITKK